MERALPTRICREARGVEWQRCSARVVVTVSHGLAADTYYYEAGTGALVGSASWNDQDQQVEVGDTSTASCSEACLVCGKLNLPMPACTKAETSFDGERG
ncbi:MAG: hypothetical protein QM756_02760 [Polyangiaceae bacterium]